MGARGSSAADIHWKIGMSQGNTPNKISDLWVHPWLVGGLEHFYVSIYWE